MTRLRDLLGKPPRQSVHLPSWIDRLLSIGIVSTDPHVIRRQRCVNVAVLATVGSTISHIVMNSLHDFYGLIVVNIYNVFMIFVPMLIPQLHRFGENVGAIALALIILFGHSFVVWSARPRQRSSSLFHDFSKRLSPPGRSAATGDCFLSSSSLFLVALLIAAQLSRRSMGCSSRRMTSSATMLSSSGHDQCHIDQRCDLLLRADLGASRRGRYRKCTGAIRRLDRHHDAALRSPSG